jgi:hypothetical protein
VVWLECLKPIHKCSLLDDSFINIMDMLYQKLDVDQLQLVAITMRLLWLRRNTWVFDGVFQTPTSLVRVAHDQHDVFFALQNKEDGARPTLYSPW